MGRYVLRRLLVLPAVLLAVYSIVFLMVRATPGGPWDPGAMVPPAIIENLRQYYHTDDPIWRQYWRLLGELLLRGNFGLSYATSRSVGEMIAQALPVSLQLGAASMVVATLGGVALGLAAGVRQNTIVDYAAMPIGLIGISVPAYVSAPLLVVLFAVQWHVLPSEGWEGLFSRAAAIPVFTLALAPAAGLARYARAAVLDVLQFDFVRTARAKGMPAGNVLLRHIAPNMLIPVVTVAGSYLASVLTGAFFVEWIYAIPGMGRLLVQGIFGRDYPVILGSTVVAAAIIAVTNLLVDLSYAFIDPRIRYG
jgi:oligopeptide transport system permease protein